MEENIDKIVYVLDTSFALAYIYPDEQNREAVDRFRDFKNHEIGFITSTLLPYEIINSLRTSILRNRLTPEKALQLYRDFNRYQIEQVELEFETILQYGIENNITCYDASYIVLAKERGFPLLTFDERLKELFS